MTAPHRVRYGVQKTLYHVPRDRYARVSVPTGTPAYSIVALWRHDEAEDREIVASTNTSVDSTTTTLDEDAGPAEANPKLLPVTSEADFIPGRRYLLSQGTASEVVTCERTTTGQVLVKQELRNAYTTGATLRGIEISATFPDDAADEQDLEAGGGPYGIVWSYTINGVGYYPIEEAWVVRYDTIPLITTDYLSIHWPEMSSMTSNRWSPEDLIVAASDRIYADIEASNRDPHGLRHDRILSVCCVYRCIEIVHDHVKSEQAGEIATKYGDLADRLLRDLLTGQAPVRTAEIKQSTNTASQGGSKTYGLPIIRRS